MLQGVFTCDATQGVYRVPKTPPNSPKARGADASESEDDWGTWRAPFTAFPRRVQVAKAVETAESAKAVKTVEGAKAAGKASVISAGSAKAAGKASVTSAPRFATGSIFSHPPLGKQQQQRLEKSRSSFAQRVADTRAKAIGSASRSAGEPKKRGAVEPPRDLGTVPEEQREAEEQEQVMSMRLGTLAELRVAARARRQDQILAARQRVAAEADRAGLSEAAYLHTDSEGSTATQWWKGRIRAAETIEEVSRLEVNFKKLQRLQKETQSAEIEISSESEREELSFKETSSGVGESSAGERGESSTPTVDLVLVVSPVEDLIGHWVTETEEEVIPETPPPPGVVASYGVSEGAPCAPDTPGPVVPETPPPVDHAKASTREVLEKAAARELLESLVREQERQERQDGEVFGCGTRRFSKFGCSCTRSAAEVSGPHAKGFQAPAGSRTTADC